MQHKRNSRNSVIKQQTESDFKNRQRTWTGIISMEDIQIAKRYMRTCSASLIIRKWKSKPQWDIISPLLGWWFSKRKELSIGRSVKKRKPSSAVGRDINWCSHMEKSMGEVLKKIKNKTNMWSRNPTSGHVPKGNENRVSVLPYSLHNSQDV